MQTGNLTPTELQYVLNHHTKPGSDLHRMAEEILVLRDRAVRDDLTILSYQNLLQDIALACGEKIGDPIYAGNQHIVDRVRALKVKAVVAGALSRVPVQEGEPR